MRVLGLVLAGISGAIVGFLFGFALASS